jgi:uncharacterized protein
MAIESPCADICKFDRKADLCVGCFRTVAEIRQWRKFTDHKRRQILAGRRRRETNLAGSKTARPARQWRRSEQYAASERVGKSPLVWTNLLPATSTLPFSAQPTSERVFAYGAVCNQS